MIELTAHVRVNTREPEETAAMRLGAENPREALTLLLLGISRMFSIQDHLNMQEAASINPLLMKKP